MYLRQPAIAQIVVGSIHKGVELGHFDLGAYVVMPNHVHLLILPKIAPDRLMKSLKGSSAREANRVLGRVNRFGKRNPTIIGCETTESLRRFERILKAIL